MLLLPSCSVLHASVTMCVHAQELDVSDEPQAAIATSNISQPVTGRVGGPISGSKQVLYSVYVHDRCAAGVPSPLAEQCVFGSVFSQRRPNVRVSVSPVSFTSPVSDRRAITWRGLPSIISLLAGRLGSRWRDSMLAAVGWADGGVSVKCELALSDVPAYRRCCQCGAS